ncbi:MAG: choice-of-anchor tandem repeat GloVer-containing protein [Candidatus Sulfotelmatobacter sp.]
MTKVSLKHLALLAGCGLALSAFVGLAHAQLTQLYAFQYNPSTISNYPDGEVPIAELIQGADGNYYTTTTEGGSGACPGGVDGLIPGCGAIVKITSAGALSVFYSFPYDSSTNTAPNGLRPAAGLVQGPDGNFYGVASQGGSSGTDFCSGDGGITGCGTVFKITPKGVFTLLYSFCGGYGCGTAPPDGAAPIGRLVYSGGYYYGTTQQGSEYDGYYNSGTIFRISPSGKYKIMHNFSGCCGTGDGESPAAGLTLGSDGNLYGTTQAGGTSGNGTVFKMTPAGTVTILYSFASDDPNGTEPVSALIQASDGNLYGTCYSGGANERGTVFRISTSGAIKKLYDFTLAAGNVGYNPQAGLIQASDGNLYGTTSGGGADGIGAIYQVTLAGAATLEASFGGAPGYSPVGTLVQGSDGKLYVTAQSGGGTNSSGVADEGTIDVFNAGLPVPAPGIVKITPTKGAVGKKVTISQGPYIGATAVKFNGTSAAFTVEGSEFITTTVPAGATSGTISVTTPGGTAVSTQSFTVLP